MLRPDHTLFTYLHLAPAPELTKGLQASGATCVAYETVEDAQGRLPLLAPMSEVAGKSRPRRAPSSWRSRSAAAASCSAGSRAWRRRT